MIATEVWYTIDHGRRHMLRLDRPMSLGPDGEEFPDIAEMCAEADVRGAWFHGRSVIDVTLYASADGPALGTCEVTIEMRPKFKARRIT